MTHTQADVLVIGAGAAGLHAALEAAEAGASVALVSRKLLAESASFRAQGGMAAAIGPDDSPARHAEDTINAGRDACRSAAVDALVGDAPAAVEKLLERGVPFDKNADGSLALGLEGGHSARRIVHAGGSETGRAITSRLTRLATDDPRIDVQEGVSATALWSDGERCHGVITDRGAIAASATILATGGAAALWRRTTNPWGAIGAGAVVAQAAGAEIADLELCQFHPTALALEGHARDGALITEAIRGEGATLHDAAGNRFTDELAPRDQVSAAILDRMAADDSPCAWLEMSEIDIDRFETVRDTLREAGIDPATERVPVAPAAHYTMGGIVVDTSAATNVKGLFAVGECSCSGLHGANRLASNSLSECFVFGSRAARAAITLPGPDTTTPVPTWTFDPPLPETRDAVWRLAGPLRRPEQLEALLDDPYPLARMIARAALERAESRGAHRRSDHSGRDRGLDHQHLIWDATGTLRRERWA